MNNYDKDMSKFKHFKESRDVVLTFMHNYLLDVDYNLQPISAIDYLYQETIIWYSPLQAIFFKVYVSDTQTNISVFKGDALYKATKNELGYAFDKDESGVVI